MQLVLDDQVGRRERLRKLLSDAGLPRPVEACRVVTVRASQQRAARTRPRQARELVDRRDDEARHATVQRLVHGDDRQRVLSLESASRVLTQQPELIGMAGVRLDAAIRPRPHELERIGLQPPPAPRTGLHRHGRRLPAVVLEGDRLGAGRRPVALAHLPMRFGVAALPTHRPISNGQAPSRSGASCRSSSSAQIERRRAAELVQREQPQRVAHQHRHARGRQRRDRAAGGAESRTRRGPGTPRSCRRRSGRTADRPARGRCVSARRSRAGSSG